jgi:hypothetical protein
MKKRFSEKQIIVFATSLIHQPSPTETSSGGSVSARNRSRLVRGLLEHPSKGAAKYTIMDGLPVRCRSRLAGPVRVR